MFCSFIVEPKDSYNLANKAPDSTNNGNVRNPNVEFSEYIRSVISNWAKAKPKPSNSKGVGGTKKKKWTPEEDQLLIDGISKFGSDWKEVATVVPGRTGKQCRERWLSRMCPTLVHMEWTPQEDIILIQKQKEIGNKWSIVSSFLPGRSTTAVKNRWNYLCRRDIPNHSEEYQQIFQNISMIQNNQPVNVPPPAPVVDFAAHDVIDYDQLLEDDSWAQLNNPEIENQFGLFSF